MKTALLIVDVQNDFCPGGALAVKNGDAIVPVINRIMDRFDYVLASKDWHPEQTVHFEKWPVHCVAETHGAKFNADLDKDKIDELFLKGTKNKDDGYSAFEATNIPLTDYLRNHEIDTVYVCGLATDYCVKATALDAVKNNFHTYVITDAVAAVNLQPDDGDKALEEMHKNGCLLIASRDIEK